MSQCIRLVECAYIYLHDTSKQISTEHRSRSAHCSVLQRDAACCSVLQRVAMCCREMYVGVDPGKGLVDQYICTHTHTCIHTHVRLSLTHSLAVFVSQTHT